MTQQKSGSPQGYGQGGTETTKDRLRDMADTTGEKMKDAASSAQEMAGKVADQAREYGEQAQEVAKRVGPFLDKSLKEKPMTTLAGAAVLGFVLGASGRNRRSLRAEVIDEGIAGFIVDNEDEAVAAISELDRQRVRATFERRITAR